MASRTWWELKRRDEGMSVFEVVLAAFILFFVLTAILGLVGTSTRMNLNAKGRTAMNNAVASHIEWVRSLDFEQIAMSGSSPEAVVDPTYTYTVDGFTITITNTISAGQGGTKELQVTATAAADGLPTVTMSTLTAIRDSESLTERFDEDENAPKVEFKSLTAAPDTVVYSSYEMGGAPLYVEGWAKAQNGGTISEFAFYCGTEILRDGATIFANVAYWTPGTEIVQKTFRWDTRQVNEDGQRAILDGWRMVRINATDSNGLQTFLDRRLYVDNDPPSPPAGGPAAEVRSSTETRLSWPVAMDGTDATWKYGLEIHKRSASATWELDNSYIITDPAYIQTTTPFSLYKASVRSGSPRNLWSELVEGAEEYVSRAEASGESTTTYTGKNNTRTSNTDVSISCTPPSFATTQIRYDVFRALDPTTMGGAPYATDTGPAFAETVTKKVGKFGVPDTWYYQFRVTFTPEGGTEMAVWSNVIGPIAVDGAEPMEHVTW